MKLGNRIPVESLDDERLTQIERRIVAGAADRLATPARSPRRALAFAGGMLALAAAVLVGWRLRGPERAPAAAREPETFAMRTTGQQASVSIGDATIASEPGSDVQITHDGARVVIDMKRGTVDLAVVHRPGRVVVVRAGETEVEDVGTRFSVSYDGASAVDVRVKEGEVKVTRQQRSVEVTAGEEWTVGGGVVAIAEKEETGAGMGTGTGTGTGSGSGSGSGSAVVIAMHGHVAAVPDVGVTPRHVAMKARVVERVQEVVAQRHVAVPSDPYVDLKVAIRQQPVAFDPKLDGSGDAAVEIAKLKPVAYAPQRYGDEASLALYRIAVLLYKPLHQDAEALRTLELYQRRFPAGKQLAAALWLRVRIDCAHTIDDECRKAAYSYQHLVPTGPAADVAIRITNAQ